MPGLTSNCLLGRLSSTFLPQNFHTKLRSKRARGHLGPSWHQLGREFARSLVCSNSFGIHLKLCSPHKDSLQNVPSPMHPNFKHFLLHAWLDFQLPPWPPQLYFFASKFSYKTPIETGSGPSWAILAPTWTNLGPTLANFGPTWANLVPNWELTWPIWDQSEPIWDQLGPT